MARWRLQNPGNFSVAFHEAMRQGLGDHVVDRYHTFHAVKAAQAEWQLFRYCLRHYPLHPSARLEAKFDRRTSKGYNDFLHRWELRIRVSPSAESILENASLGDWA